MTALRYSTLSPSGDRTPHWRKALESCLATLHGVEAAKDEETGEIVFVDADGVSNSVLRERLATLDRRGRAVILVVSEDNASGGGEDVPEVLADGQVDDILVHPFRPLEVLGKLRLYQQILMWNEVQTLNNSFSDLIGRLQEDLQLAERLQRLHTPKRFPKIQGLELHSRYLAGARSGGDHFDLAESRDGKHLSVVLTDSSTYGLSSAVLSSLVRVAARVSPATAGACATAIQGIRDDVAAVLGSKGELSAFYGVIDRPTLELRYVHLGRSQVYYQRAGAPAKLLPSTGGALQGQPPADPNQPPPTRPASGPSLSESVLQLEPGGRLILLSDGWAEALGEKSVDDLVDHFEKKDAPGLINELTFLTKKEAGTEGLPPQDCSILVIEVPTPVLKLTRPEERGLKPTASDDWLDD